MSVYVSGTQARAYDELRDLSPWSVEQYLALSEWTRVEVVPKTYGVWEKIDGSASLLLPYDRNLRDYRQRFREALECVSELTNLVDEALALEVISARKDVFLLRADQVTLDGSIPFLEAQRLISGVQDLLTSAAATTIRPRASTAGRKPALVSDFLRDDVRMGHTLHGSFVITVLASDGAEEARLRRDWHRVQYSPETEAGDTTDTGREREVTADERDYISFPRQVMATLATGLSASRDLGTELGSSIEQAVESGVTVQILETVDRLSQIEGVRALDMNFKWSRVEPEPAGLPTRVELTRESSERARPYIERLGKTPDVEQDVIIGQVVTLDRPEGSEDGQVIVEGSVGKTRRRVRVPLSGEAYRLAIAAHDASRPVTVAGTFTRRARGWRMDPGAIISELNLPNHNA